MGTAGHGDVANARAGWLIPFRKMRRPTADPNDPETWEQAEYANTLDANGNVTRTAHAIASELDVRQLMPVECERLQGFPDGWTDGHSDTHRYRMLGNAVAVPVVEWIGNRLMEAA